MSIQSEQEFKTLVTADQAAKLQAELTFTPAFGQVNTYYDTPDFRLQHAGLGLRIRQFNTRAEQTLKLPKGPDRLLEEMTDPLTVGEARQLIRANSIATHGQIRDYLTSQRIQPDTLQQFAAATTLRRLLDVPAGKLTLDETRYPNGTFDWELELEYLDAQAAKAYWEKLLSSNDIKPKTATNKVARAYANVNISQAD